ncbi:putative piwi like protein [Blattamonas nauphoetae]|uniref:Piwi like protein n=1 Tax=Blattamonas nauphoetae TaxID=2049346 RepID=A0ABQ9X639_9EUKA|nr:putative piwi like protein [Blattamonas nauphoetae]
MSEIVHFAPRPPIQAPSGGSRGLHIVANSYQIKVKISLFQYSVHFEPLLDSQRERKRRQKIIDRLIDESLAPLRCVFDNTSLYSFGSPLDNVQFQVVDTIQGKKQDFTIGFELVRESNPGDNSFPLQQLNVLLKGVQAQNGFVQIRRDMVHPANKQELPKYRLEIWSGTRFSIYLSQKGPMMVADKIHSILRKDTVLDFLNKNDGIRREDKVESLEGMFILTKHGDHFLTYRIVKVLTDQTPRTYTFMRRAGKDATVQETVEQYFKDCYSITLKPNQPLLLCMATGSGGRVFKITASSKPVAIPSELAFMTGIPEEFHSDFFAMKEIKDRIGSSPQERKRQIEDVTRTLFQSPQFPQSGIEAISNTMVPIDARVCAPVVLRWGGNKQEEVRNGSFRDSVTRNTLIAPVALQKWLLVYQKQDERNIAQFMDALRKVAKNPQLVANPDKIIVDNERTFFDQFKKDFGPQYKDHQLVIFILPKKTTTLYRNLKQHTNCACGVMSQCIISKNIQRINLSVISGLWLQIVAKVKGSCWRIQNPTWVKQNPESTKKESGGVMVCSIDVSRSMKKKQSYAALVASYSNDMTQYHLRTMILKGRQELLTERLDKFIKMSIELYERENKAPPSTIIMYRDGVGDSQFEAAVQGEYNMILKGIRDYAPQPVYRPQTAYIMVNKRINHRFFTPNGDNIQPGTIVDTVVTSPLYYDFFLVAQSVNRFTTALPTRFVVLQSDLKWTNHQLQDFTYQLCHLYCNFPGAISLPMPVQVAHKLSLYSQDILDGKDSKISQLPFIF